MTDQQDGIKDRPLTRLEAAGPSQLWAPHVGLTGAFNETVSLLNFSLLPVWLLSPLPTGVGPQSTRHELPAPDSHSQNLLPATITSTLRSVPIRIANYSHLSSVRPSRSQTLSQLIIPTSLLTPDWELPEAGNGEVSFPIWLVRAGAQSFVDWLD